MTAVDTRVRSVLDAPRGTRFTRTPAPSAPRRVATPPETFEDREQRLLRQMAGNPKVAYRLEHGVTPHWMTVAKERREQAERQAREAESREPDPESDPGPFPPRRPRGRHRAPRWKGGWAAAMLTYGMALAAGMGISQVAASLL